MTVHDALDHPWLREDHSSLDARFPSNRYDLLRQRIRSRYVSDIHLASTKLCLTDRLFVYSRPAWTLLSLLVEQHGGVRCVGIVLKNTKFTIVSGVCSCATP